MLDKTMARGLLTIAIVLGMGVGSAWSQIRYTVTDLGTLGGTASVATCINSSGQVAGYSLDNSGNQQAFLFSGGSLHALGNLGGLNSWASAINDVGQITGFGSNSRGYLHAYLYSSGTMQDLGVPPGGVWTEAFGINNDAQVVGGIGTGLGFLYSGGTMQSLGTLGGGLSEAYSINNIGEIVGDAEQ